MSVVPMKLLTIAGPLERFDDVVRACVIDQEFHPENALQLMRSVKGLRPLELENPYSALLHRSVEVADEAGIPLAYAPFDPASPLEDFASYFDSLSGRIAALHRRREELEHKADEARSMVDQLQNLRGLNDSLDELWGLDHARFRYGYLPRETYDGFREALNEEEDIFFVPTTLGARRVYGVYFTTKEAHHKVDSLFNSLHFVRIRLEDPPGGTVDNATAELNAQVEAAQAAVAQVGQELEELRRQEREHILSSYSYLRYHSECCGLRQYACRSKGTFYLTGWVPAAAVPEIEETLARFPNLSCVADTADDVRHAKPPTKLKTCFLGRVFQPFLEMYGLPAYNEKDPSLFMALTYCLFFGIMFGDLGQGLCLALIGLVLARWKGMWLGGIITCCGLSGALFGCVYGSVFGFEDILPGFKIMEETTFAGLGVVSNVLLLLVLSICLGVFMLLLVMVINILNGIRQKNYEKLPTVWKNF